ncbi:hypothetical protein EXS72_01890 [Candidatus Pacearchaeota archaeon]|nr:hypothetical protein [Candidatus Pacearchaeota archaeon]
MSIDVVIKEKISADHLLYVSLKYTKTCDVILNLLLRWKIMVDNSLDLLILKAGKKWKPVSPAPRAKLIQLQKIYADEPIVMEVLNLYEFFRDIEQLDKSRECEFRKGVNLKVQYKNKPVNINLEQLALYSQIFERFISYLK